MKKADHWTTEIFQSSPIISQLKNTTRYFKCFDKWPTLESYQKLFSDYSLDIQPVEQANEANTFEELYESRVYLKKELQTRTENWHDFFNAMVWINFPHTKKTLNQLHYSESVKRPKGSNRSTLENRITQFDECGAILVSDNKDLLNQVRQHEWHKLFIENRDMVIEHLQCVVFGHAIFEKAISPYIGMTCHCILINDKKLFTKVKAHDYSDLDVYLSDKWKTKMAKAPVKFDALPVLGIPGYWPDQDETFYQDRHYFR